MCKTPQTIIVWWALEAPVREIIFFPPKKIHLFQFSQKHEFSDSFIEQIISLKNALPKAGTSVDRRAKQKEREKENDSFIDFTSAQTKIKASLHSL